MTTPIFSVNGLQQMPAAETRMIIHKNSFVYNTLVLSPSVNNEFKVGRKPRPVLISSSGAKPDAGNAFNLQVTYRFKKDGKEVRKLGPPSRSPARSSASPSP